MKRVVPILFVLAALGGAGEIDVQTILQKLERVGNWQIPAEPDFKIYDPFKRAERFVKTRRKPVVLRKRKAWDLSAILNDRAFLNGRWVRAGEMIGSYRVASVRSDGLVLKRGSRLLFVPLRRKRALLKIKDIER